MQHFLLLLLLLPFYTSFSLSTPITLPLSHHPSTPLSHLAASSLLRASLLKSPKHNSVPSTSPLSPHSYGGYSLPLLLGSPPQSLPFLLDTGSQLTWTPCTKSYKCQNCPSPVPFLPKLSSSSKLIGCLNPKCSWIHHTLNCPRCDPPSRDQNNNNNNNNNNNETCNNNTTQLCPPYFLIYGSGSTAGLLLSDTLRLSDLTFPNFGVGCSLVSDSQPSGGVAGFGRGSVSLPAQLNLTRFSYCLVSRRYDDDRNVSGSLVLDGRPDSSVDGVKFTPFLKNPNVNDVFSIYYYIGLDRITVGGKKVKIPKQALVPGADGNGGVIIDSGTTFTYLEPTAFEALATAFGEQSEYKRSEAAERESGLRPCFELPGGGGGEVSLPELAFHFKGGAEMRLPLMNYFALAGEETAGAVCLTVVSDGGDGGGGEGPSMILGSFQQQNFYMVYDLEREKLGFRQQDSCTTTGS